MANNELIASALGTTVPRPIKLCEQVPRPGRVGLEFEWESVSPPARAALRAWRQVHDGSLRGSGAEFVLRGAHGGASLHRRLLELATLFEHREHEATWRCATHVHVDVRDMLETQVINLIAVSIIFETHLAAISGGRRSSNYCLLERDIDSASSRVVMSRPIGRLVRRLAEGGSKYRALNTLPVATQGSLEYRHSHSHNNPMDALPWINTLLAMREWAMEYEGTIDQLIDKAQHEYFPLVDEVFKEMGDEIAAVYRGDYEAAASCQALQSYSPKLEAVPRYKRTSALTSLIKEMRGEDSSDEPETIRRAVRVERVAGPDWAGTAGLGTAGPEARARMQRVLESIERGFLSSEEFTISDVENEDSDDE